jgi:hypothetical protein
MDVVWILMTFLIAKAPTVDLAFKTQAACEHMVAALSDPACKLPGAKSSITGYQCRSRYRASRVGRSFPDHTAGLWPAW